MENTKRYYRDVLGTVEGLRRGITTGTCAAAAAKAAVLFAIQHFSQQGNGSQERLTTVCVTLPTSRREYGGREIEIPIESVACDGEWFTATVRKDAGDDEDITHNAIIGARVKIVKGAITIDGGEGVGTVTKPGLNVPVGEKAINPTPTAMIRDELVPLLDVVNSVKQKRTEHERLGFAVGIFVPEGERLAEKTWNPRLGIEGGISIIGTGGVVEPRSSKAFMSTIATVIRAASERGVQTLFLTPGYVGERYLLRELRVPEEQVVTVGDHVGFAFRQSADRGFRNIVFAGHIGKTAKIAAGLFNTHSRYGDARLETIAACAASCGASSSVIQDLLQLRLAEDAVPLLKREKLTRTFDLLADRAVWRLKEQVRKTGPGGEGEQEGGTEEAEVFCVCLDLHAKPLNAVCEIGPNNMKPKEDDSNG